MTRPSVPGRNKNRSPPRPADKARKRGIRGHISATPDEGKLVEGAAFHRVCRRDLNRIDRHSENVKSGKKKGRAIQSPRP